MTDSYYYIIFYFGNGLKMNQIIYLISFSIAFTVVPHALYYLFFFSQFQSLSSQLFMDKMVQWLYE